MKTNDPIGVVDFYNISKVKILFFGDPWWCFDITRSFLFSVKAILSKRRYSSVKIDKLANLGTLAATSVRIVLIWMGTSWSFVSEELLPWFCLVSKNLEVSRFLLNSIFSMIAIILTRHLSHYQRTNDFDHHTS